MKKQIAISILLLCSCAFAQTFEERVALAEKAEKAPESSKYLLESVQPVIRGKINEGMKKCTAVKDWDKRDFKIVAELTPEGKVTNTDFQPKPDNTAECLSKVLAESTVPAHTLKGNIPMSLQMKMK